MKITSDEYTPSKNLRLVKISVFLAMYAVNFAFSIFWRLFRSLNYLDALTLPSELLVCYALTFITVVIPAIGIFAICLLTLVNLAKRPSTSIFTAFMLLIMILGWFIAILESFFGVLKCYNQLILFVGLSMGLGGTLFSGVGEYMDRAGRDAQPSGLVNGGRFILIFGIMGYIVALSERFSFLYAAFYIVLGPLTLLIGMSLWVIGTSK